MSRPSPTSLGKAAEEATAEYLRKGSYEILELNWRRRTCEIDVIAKKDEIIYFVEVKYRTAASQGSGLDYITPKKLKQMRFAANFWVAENNWPGDYRLMAAEVASDNLKPKLSKLVEV
ncbi:MAG TPA: YraN family protein [Candidatus Saccharimonadales bacterium]|nr:YraN family protein [Candidatus Saccharimonadales bacterium]